MSRTGYPQPLEQMERVDQSSISEKLDEMLDRIDKENIGFVITENGKDKYVLCPYCWFDEDFDDDLGCVVNSAIRQEMSAASENSEAVQRFILNHYKAFDDRTLQVAVKDMEYHFNSPLHELKTPESWRDLWALLREEVALRDSKKEVAKQHE